MHVCTWRRQHRGSIISVKAFRLSLDPGLTWLISGWSTEQAHSIRLRDERRASAERFVGTDVRLPPSEGRVGLFKDPTGVSTYLMPALQGPLSPLQHVAFVFRRFTDMPDACAQALHNFPAVLWIRQLQQTKLDKNNSVTHSDWIYCVICSGNLPAPH